MSQPQWDEEMKFELFRLKSELRLDSFRVLAMPLGLGQIQQEPSSSDAHLFPSPPVPPVSSAAFQASVLLTAPTIPSKPLPPSAPISMPLKPLEAMEEDSEENLSPADLTHEEFLVEAPKWQKYSRFVLVHALDLVFVGTCVGLGLLVLTWVTDPTHMSFDWKVLSQAPAVAVLQKMRVGALIIGLYLVFTLYWLFFRFVSGQTLGETCVHSFSQGEETLAAQLEKDSEKT